MARLLLPPLAPMSLVAPQLALQASPAPLLVRESSTQLRRAYQATEALQRVDLVLRYAAPPSALLTRVCLDAFVELAGLGFFADSGLSADAASATLVDDEVQGSASIETCALDLSNVSPRGFDWLAQALRNVGAWVFGITAVGDPDVLAVHRPANSIAPAPFGVATRRSGRGFYVRVELDRPVTDDDEAAFRTLVTGFRRYALALPSREGHAHCHFTVSPSFERGSTVLGVAGGLQDASSSEIEGPFLAALTRFHHVVAPLRRVEMVLAS